MPLPERLIEALRGHSQQVAALHREYLAGGAGFVYLPHALARQAPNAPREWIWQYVFPSARLSTNLKAGVVHGIICTRRAINYSNPAVAPRVGANLFSPVNAFRATEVAPTQSA